jgi:NADH:ubiquinone oxidoreductase subunit H
LLLLCLVGVSVYSSLIRGVIRKSKYASIGALRACSQRVTFEVVFTFFLLCIFFFFAAFILDYYFNFRLLVLFFILVILILAELNRAPFDFSEGERELVRGFNVEYSGIIFALLFLGEYGALIFFSIILSLLVFYGSLIIFFFIFSFILLIRSSFPRYRYDLFMNFFWVNLLPLSLLFFLYFFMISFNYILFFRFYFINIFFTICLFGWEELFWSF